MLLDAEHDSMSLTYRWSHVMRQQPLGAVEQVLLQLAVTLRCCLHNGCMARAGGWQYGSAKRYLALLINLIFSKLTGSYQRRVVERAADLNCHRWGAPHWCTWGYRQGLLVGPLITPTRTQPGKLGSTSWSSWSLYWQLSAKDCRLGLWPQLTYFKDGYSARGVHMRTTPQKGDKTRSDRCTASYFKRELQHKEVWYASRICN